MSRSVRPPPPPVVRKAEISSGVSLLLLGLLLYVLCESYNNDSEPAPSCPAGDGDLYSSTAYLSYAVIGLGVALAVYSGGVARALFGCRCRDEADFCTGVCTGAFGMLVVLIALAAVVAISVQHYAAITRAFNEFEVQPWNPDWSWSYCHPAVLYPGLLINVLVTVTAAAVGGYSIYKAVAKWQADADVDVSKNKKDKREKKDFSDEDVREKHERKWGRVEEQFKLLGVDVEELA